MESLGLSRILKLKTLLVDELPAHPQQASPSTSLKSMSTRGCVDSLPAFSCAGATFNIRV